MSCNLRRNILEALVAEARGSIETARMNVEVYLHNPVGIGEHPNVMGAIQDQLDVIAENQERLEVLDRHFRFHTHDD